MKLSTFQMMQRKIECLIFFIDRTCPNICCRILTSLCDFESVVSTIHIFPSNVPKIICGTFLANQTHQDQDSKKKVSTSTHRIEPARSLIDLQLRNEKEGNVGQVVTNDSPCRLASYLTFFTSFLRIQMN